MQRYRSKAKRLHELWVSGVETLFSIPKKPSRFLIAGLLLITALADYLIPAEHNLTSVYALLVLFAAWNTSTGFTLAVVALSSIMQLNELVPFKGTNAMPLSLYLDRANRLLTFVFVFALAVPLRFIYYREKSTARMDSLTGAPNRQAFTELLGVAIARRDREQSPFCVAYMDVDNLKQVNDRYGHSAGDKVLQMVTRTLTSTVRRSDYIARLSGDEFALLLPNTNLDVAKQVLGRVVKNVDANMQKHQWPITLSIGAGCFSEPGLTSDEVVNYCDALMYSVKKSGKNDIAYGRYPHRP